ncbi:hypothetical protein B0H17DRAFT_1213791 [Mycena rosella]|uniref:Uncharacterized protein n=1 Tax=Mycena rosella TaxID=1033263 RepID=A0AAD7CPF2_MYCRO|nr:hypothetical protein B0H17DRAFT_1213791 [Mycena rosella]
MANSTPSQAAARPPTPRRLRILALRDSLQRQIYRQTEEFSPPIPRDPACTSSCRIQKAMCYGRGEDFENIGRWTAMCIIRDHASSGRPCTKIQMITPKLLAWQLDVLSALWVRYDLTGKKWGKQEVPERLHAMLPGPALPLVPSAPRPRNTAARLPPLPPKVVNRQDRKKFKNMDVTGTINAQCSHVFVIASVDMHHSERFANTDAALARMLRKMDRRKGADVQFRLALDAIDQVVTYDIACEYYAKIKARFRASPDLADVAEMVDRIRWGIPALHVTGHKADCTYLFGTAYMDCVGHFHGETAEAYWPSANRIGGHARQMNNGHRQDTLIDVTLYDDLSSAKKLFVQKRNLFIGLSLSNLDHIDEWQRKARQTKKTTGGVTSVYRHTTSKVPSQTTIYQHMIANLENFASTQVPANEIAVFLKEGLKCQADQRKITDARSKNDEHDLQATKKEIATRRAKLTIQLVKFREVRDNVMLEAETLWLPSDFTEVQRVAMGPNIIALAAEEEAYDLIRHIQTICKGLSALEDRKRDVRGQKNNIISGEQALDTRHRRDCAIKAYNSVRKAMISLGTACDEGDQFPPLTINDTFMKSRRRERALGDSRRGDGMLYTRIGIAAGSKVSNAPAVEDEDEEGSDDEPDSKRIRPGNQGGTQMTKRATTEQRREKQLEALTNLDPNPANKNGWLWELRRPSNMTDIEMQNWESDRVQWARAEAEMDRFPEQVEMSAAESPSYKEQANETANMWVVLANQCRRHLKMAGYQFALEPDFDFAALIAYIERSVT